MLCILILSGCSMLSPQIDPVLNNRAVETAERVRYINQDIQSCKGAGWLYIRTGARKESFRMAYAAKPPDRIRLTLLSSGHPVETILADGRTVTFISHTGRHKTTTYQSKDPSLKDILSIPVRMSDIIRLLSGRIPVQEFSRATFISENNETALIELGRNMFSSRQLLSVEPDGSPSMLRLLDSGDSPLFSIYFDQFTQFETRTIAASCSIQDESGRTADISITSFQPDVPVNDEIFRLTAGR